MVEFEQDDDGGPIDSKIRLSQEPLVHLRSRQCLGNRLESHLELVDRARSVRPIRGLRTYFHQATTLIVVALNVTLSLPNSLPKHSLRPQTRAVVERQAIHHQFPP